MPFSLEQSFSFVNDALEWDIVIKNQMYYRLEIADINIDFPMSSFSDRSQVGLFEGGYLRHLFISGDGSFLIFTKRSGKPPYLVMTVKPGTSLEYYDGDSYFIHSGYTGTSIVVDPVAETALIILANRAHPDDSGTTRPLRTQIADLVFAAKYEE